MHIDLTRPLNGHGKKPPLCVVPVLPGGSVWGSRIAPQFTVVVNAKNKKPITLPIQGT